MSKVLCMEIGTSIVRLAEVKKTPGSKKIEITKVHVFDTPDDATKDGKVRYSDSVVAAIRDGIDESGIKATDVYFVVESTKILFKQVELPLVPANKIQSTLDLAFSDIFPVDETLYHLSYVFEKKYQKNGQWLMALDVFAVPNDLSESYYNLAASLGLNAKGLTDTSRSMISLFPDSFMNKNVAMINLNENSSTLTVSVEGDMVFNKTVPNGVYNTIQTIRNSSLTMDNLEFTDAVGHLYTQNLLLRHIPEVMTDFTTEEEKLRYDLTMSVVSTIKTIEATFASFLAKENITIKEIHLSGLGAGFGGITQLLEYEFGIPVTVVQQDGNLNINKSAADEPLLLGCYPCAGAAIDAANFFTAAEKAGGAIAAKKKLDSAFIFIGILICLVSIGYSAFTFLDANLKLQTAELENTKLTKSVEDLKSRGVELAYNNYNTAVSYNEEVLNLYDETRSENEEMTIFLEELETILPSSARVVSMTLNPKTASVSFVCEDKFVAAGVLHLLRNMKTTHNMQCSGVGEVEKTNEIGFTVEFTLKSTADRDAENQPNDDEIEDDIVDTPTSTQPLVVDAVENTTEDISMVNYATIESVRLDELTMQTINDAGFVDGGIFTAENQALTMLGRSFTDANGIEIAITENVDGGVDLLFTDSDAFTFYGGIKVGMTELELSEILSSINVTVENSDFAIIKNSTHTLVCEQQNGVVSAIYLLNNILIDDMTESDYTNNEVPSLDDDLEFDDGFDDVGLEIEDMPGGDS